MPAYEAFNTENDQIDDEPEEAGLADTKTVYEGMVRHTMIPLLELRPVPESSPQVHAILTQLGDRFDRHDITIQKLADQGIFVWKDEQGRLKIEDKDENGRGHFALITASLGEGGIDWVNMQWRNGEGPYSRAMLSGSAPPEELLTALGDIIAIERELFPSESERRFITDLGPDNYLG